MVGRSVAADGCRRNHHVALQRVIVHREFAPSLPDNITQRIERALVACTPLHYDKMPRSNVKRVRGSLVQINIYVTC